MPQWSECNGCLWLARAHFSSLPKAREKFAVDSGGLWEADARCHVTGNAPIWVLVNGTRNERWNICLCLATWEKTRGSLDSRMENHSNIRFISETEERPRGRNG